MRETRLGKDTPLRTPEWVLGVVTLFPASIQHPITSLSNLQPCWRSFPWGQKPAQRVDSALCQPPVQWASPSRETAEEQKPGGMRETLGCDPIVAFGMDFSSSIWKQLNTKYYARKLQLRTDRPPAFMEIIVWWRRQKINKSAKSQNDIYIVMSAQKEINRCCGRK